MIRQEGQVATEPTASMRTVINYFRELGPRWGLAPETTAAHALLYLTGARLGAAEIAQSLDLEIPDAQAAIDDLVAWRVVEQTDDGRVSADGEPWDLLFAGMDERRRREIGPALDALSEAKTVSESDGTSRKTVMRIHSLHTLLVDLAALGNQMDQVSSTTLKRFVRFGGQMSKMLGRR